VHRFDAIKGNQRIKDILQHMAITGKVSHAYILQGAAGMGKRLFADTFAKRLQCSDSTSGEACGVCSSCIAFNSGNHPDLFYILPQKTKTLGVEDIREQIVKNAEIKQYRYPYKIFIVEHADSMTVAAQNALLKTLEEPPSYVLFLLLAENLNGFLPTILSRCVVMKLMPIPQREIEEYLVQHQLAEGNTAAMVAEYAQGSIGQAIELASSEDFLAMRQEILSILENIKEKDKPTLLEQAKQLEAYKQDYRFLDIATVWYRDILVAKTFGDGRFLIQKEKEKQLLHHAAKDSIQGILKKQHIIQETKQLLTQNANFRLAMEIMLIKLKESYNS
jgi:DNA polymerase-3 subunit delta'